MSKTCQREIRTNPIDAQSDSDLGEAPTQGSDHARHQTRPTAAGVGWGLGPLPLGHTRARAPFHHQTNLQTLELKSGHHAAAVFR